MSLPVFSQIALTFNFITLVVSLAVLLLVLLHSRRTVNVMMALFLVGIIVNAAALMVYRLTGLLGIDPEPWIMLSAAATGAQSIFLFIFSAEFSGIVRQRVRYTYIAAGLIWLISVWAIATGRVIERAGLSPEGGSLVEFSPLGVILISLLMGFLLLAVIYLILNPNPRSRSLLPGLCVFFIGSLLNVIPPAASWPVYAVMTTIAVAMIGQMLVKHQLLNPLADLNVELARANRELEIASTAKSQFMAMMSHELRTPLNAIIGFTQLLLEELYGPITGKQRDRLATILNNAQNLLDLINDVLDLSKIESGSMELNPEPVSVPEVAREVLTNHELKARQKKLGLTLDAAADVPPIIADRGHLTQMLDNLVGNAIKFTKTGGVTVQIGHLPEQQVVSIAVADTGIGIPDDALNTIFESFKQLDSSTTREFGGTGLGLTITQRLVALHGGQITVESAVGIGSTFTVYLPVAAMGR